MAYTTFAFSSGKLSGPGDIFSGSSETYNLKSVALLNSAELIPIESCKFLLLASYAGISGPEQSEMEMYTGSSEVVSRWNVAPTEEPTSNWVRVSVESVKVATVEVASTADAEVEALAMALPPALVLVPVPVLWAATSWRAHTESTKSAAKSENWTPERGRGQGR